MLTLFGLVLAIGIVVDDAIVIVENAAHHIEEGMAPKPATIQAMDEVLGPIIGITLVLMAVFLPSAFLGGITGQLYRQFALTIAATALISAINAVTLKPAQCAPVAATPQRKEELLLPRLQPRLRLVRSASTPRSSAASCESRPLMMLAFAGLVVLTGWWYQQVPTGFLPTEDQGYCIVLRAAARRRLAGAHPRRHGPGRRDPRRIPKASTPGSPSAACRCSTTAPRRTPARCSSRSSRLEERLKQGLTLDTMLAEHPHRQFGADPGSDRLRLPAAGDSRPRRPRRFRNAGRRSRRRRPRRARPGRQRASSKMLARQSGLAAPEHHVPPRRAAALCRHRPRESEAARHPAERCLRHAAGLPRLGLRQRLQQVRPHLSGPRAGRSRSFAPSPTTSARLEVRNRSGEMVPLGTLATVEKSFGPQIINRYNLYPSAAITGEPAAGRSSGEALQLMEQIADRTLPDRMGYEWTGMSYQEKRVGGEADRHLRHGRAAGLPGAWPPSTKAGSSPLGGDPGRAARPAGRGRRRVDSRHGQQHLHADRHRADHRPGQQERDSDRRVRPRAAHAGQPHPRRGRRSGPPAVPADS